MPVARLLKLVEMKGKLFVNVRWKRLGDSEDTMEPIQRVHEDVPQLLVKSLRRRNTEEKLGDQVCVELAV